MGVKKRTVTENRWRCCLPRPACRRCRVPRVFLVFCVWLWVLCTQTVLESLYMRWTPLVGTQDGTRLHVHLTKTSPGYLI